MVGHQEIEILEKFFSIFSFASIDRFQQNQCPPQHHSYMVQCGLPSTPMIMWADAPSLKHSRDYVTLRASARADSANQYAAGNQSS